MKIRSAEFSKCCVTPDQYPKDRLPEVALVGRSNVGKSSAINTLMRKKGLAKVGKVPGKTQTVNFFRVTTTASLVQEFYLVDLPGYGYAKVPKAVQMQWRPMIEGYLRSRETLCGILMFVDLRGEERSDEELLQWIRAVRCPLAIVATKADKISRGKRQAYIQNLRAGLSLSSTTPIQLFSARTNEGAQEILDVLKLFLEGKNEPC
jgi:GTP-binding protein